MILHVAHFSLRPAGLFCEGIFYECLKQYVRLSPGVWNTDSTVSVTKGFVAVLAKNIITTAAAAAAAGVVVVVVVVVVVAAAAVGSRTCTRTRSRASTSTSTNRYRRYRCYRLRRISL